MPTSGRPPGQLAAWVVLGAAVVNVAAYVALGHVGENPGDSDISYVPLATSLLNGQGYTMDGAFTDRYPPGFAFFLSLIFRLSGPANFDNVAYRWVILAVAAVTAGLVFLAARQWLTNRQALSAAALYAINPVVVGLAATRYAWNATSLFLCFFVASLWLLGRSVRHPRLSTFLGAGVSRGIATLVWPAPSWLWLIDVGLIFRTRRTQTNDRPLRHAAAFLAGIAVVILPWIATVHARTGHVALSTGLYQSMWDGVTFPLTPTSDGAARFTERANGAHAAGHLASVGAISAFYARQLIEHPRDTAEFLVRKGGHAWFASIGGTLDRAVFWSQLPLWLLAIGGGLIAWRRNRTLALYGGAIAAYFWIVAIAVMSVVRYMTPAIIMLSWFAGIALDDVVSRQTPALADTRASLRRQ